MAHPKPSSFASKAEAALQKAVKKVIAEHKRTGEPLVVWKDGKVTKISPKNIRS